MTRPTLLTPAELHQRLGELSGWRVEGSAIAKKFRFKDFQAAFAFMAAVAQVAEAAGHHPDWSNSYNRVQVRLTTHSQSGVTEKDMALAAVMDQLAEQR